MDYIALRPCTFAGNRYRIGETIPGDAVMDGKRQIALGTLAARREADADTTDITITIGGAQISFSADELQAVFDILQADSRDAAAAIQTEQRENVRQVIAACDSRRSVKTALKDAPADDSDVDAEAEAEANDEAEGETDDEKEKAGEA